MHCNGAKNKNSRIISITKYIIIYYSNIVCSRRRYSRRYPIVMVGGFWSYRGRTLSYYDLVSFVSVQSALPYRVCCLSVAYNNSYGWLVYVWRGGVMCFFVYAGNHHGAMIVARVGWGEESVCCDEGVPGCPFRVERTV